MAESISSSEALPLTYWQEIRRDFLSHRGACCGLFIILLIALSALLADVIAPHDPNHQYRDYLLTAPSFTSLNGHLPFILGTDELGRDLLSRLIYGARLSLLIGLLIVTLSASLGLLLGMLAGFWSGWLDAIIMRISDILLAIPSLLLAIVIVAVLGPGLINAGVALCLVYLPHYIRLTRAAVLAEKHKDYVQASKLAGAHSSSLMFHTLLPNCLAPFNRSSNLRLFQCHPRYGSLRVFGHGSTTPDPRVGGNAGECTRIYSKRLVGCDLSRTRHIDHRVSF